MPVAAAVSVTVLQLAALLVVLMLVPSLLLVVVVVGVLMYWISCPCTGPLGWHAAEAPRPTACAAKRTLDRSIHFPKRAC